MADDRPSAPRPAGASRDVQQRAAWLLRASRLHAEDRDLRNARVFAERLSSVAPQGHISASTLSRWETGARAVPRTAIVGYERLLGLPAGQLTGPIEVYRRFRSTSAYRAWPAGAVPPAAERQLERMLDLVGSDDPMTGRDWDVLTGLLDRLGAVYLPSRSWAQMAHRLLEECSVSDGLGWVQRYEALGRLMNHPVAGRHVVDVCADVAYDNSTRAFIETVNVLEMSHSRRANDVVLDQLIDPASDLAHIGAASACIRKIAQGHFGESDLRTVRGVIAETLRSSSASARLRRVMSDLAAQWPRSAPGAPVRQRGRLEQDEIARSQRRVLHLVRLADADDRATAATDDPMVATLLYEALFGPTEDHRLYAGHLLRVSPYRRALSLAIADVLPVQVRPVGDHDYARLLIALSRTLGSPPLVAVLRDIVEAASAPAVLRVAAANALGHASMDFEDTWSSILDSEWRRAEPSARADSGVLDGLVYSLGIVGRQDDRLARLVTVLDEGAVRTSAGYFLGLSRRTRLSAST